MTEQQPYISNCMIVDDNPGCIELLEDYINNIDNFRVSKTFTDPLVALNEIRKNDQIDYLFLDVEMPKMTGLDLAQKLRDKVTNLIFASAHARYALDAFDVAADGYLLKPFSFAKFENLVTTLAKRESVKKTKERNDFIFIRSKNENFSIIKLAFKDIVMAESFQNDIVLYTKDEKYTTHLSLKKMEDLLLAQNSFLRIHRAFVISVDHIHEILKNKVVMSNGMTVSVGDYYRSKFLSFIKSHLINSIK